MSHYAFMAHDHDQCIAGGLAAVEQICQERGLRFTKTRQRVLEILLSEHKAMGAYDILDRLRADGLGSQPAVAYRALDFLIKHGFAYRIELLNAFVACSQLDAPNPPVFLICRLCNSVSEVQSDAKRSEISRLARSAGFTIERMVRETEGICPSCARAS